jgi:hypothetical protein
MIHYQRLGIAKNDELLKTAQEMMPARKTQGRCAPPYRANAFSEQRLAGLHHHSRNPSRFGAGSITRQR